MAGKLNYQPSSRVDITLEGRELVIRQDDRILFEFVLNEPDRAYAEQKLIDAGATHER